MITGDRHTESRDATGSFSLNPVMLPAAPSIHLNVSHVSETSTVRVELRDDVGNAIAGCGFDGSGADQFSRIEAKLDEILNLLQPAAADPGRVAEEEQRRIASERKQPQSDKERDARP